MSKLKKINVSEVDGNDNSIFPPGTVWIDSRNSLRVSDGLTENGQALNVFDRNSNLAAPSGLTIGPIQAPVDGTQMFQDANGWLSIASQGTSGVTQVGWAQNPLGGGNIAVASFNDGESAEARISVGSTSGTVHEWKFNNDAKLILPGNLGYISSDATSITLYSDAAETNGMLFYDTGAEIYAKQDFAIFTDNANTSKTFRFMADGSFIGPYLSTARGDNPSGTLNGNTLKLGTNDNEVIITTPDGTESNSYAPRLVINPGKGQDGSSGEGGDIYLWAGRGGTGDGTTGGGSGGDIKIRGGQGMAGNDGGYIRIEAGDSNNDAGDAGYILLKGGQTNGGTPGYVQIQGGYNTTGLGGNVELRSGYGSIGYGDVKITTNGGGSYWTFDKDGSLTFPDSTVQTTAWTGNPELVTSYRGFKASLNQIYGNDPSINQIVISNSPNMTGNDPYPSTNDEGFTVTGLSEANVIAAVNLYGYNDYSDPIPKREIINFVKKYIDVVLYNGNTLRSSISDIQSAFNSNQSQLINSMTAGILRDDVTFNGQAKVIDSNGLDHTGSGSGSVFYITIYDSGLLIGGGDVNYADRVDAYIINPGTGYQIGDTITVPGTMLGGLTPADDLTITVNQVVNGGITEWDWSGTMANARWSNIYTNHFIFDGTNDIYDTGNFIGTNLSQCQFTATTDSDRNLIVSAVTSGSLKPFMMFRNGQTGAWVTIVTQLSGDPGGVGTYWVEGGANSDLLPNQASTNFTANGIEYGVNDTINGTDIFGSGSSYGTMVNHNNIGIFSLVALETNISSFQYRGNTGSDGQGRKETTPILYLGQDISLEANSKTWTFDLDGNIVLSNSSSIGYSELVPKVSDNGLSLVNTLDLKPNGIYNRGLKIYSTNLGADDDIRISAGFETELKLGDQHCYIGIEDNRLSISIDGRGVTPPTKIWLRDAGYTQVNREYTYDNQSNPPRWYPDDYNLATDPYIEYSDVMYKVYHPDFQDPVYVNYQDLTLGYGTSLWDERQPNTMPAPTGYYKTDAKLWTFGSGGVLYLGNDKGAIYANQTSGAVTISDNLGTNGQPVMPSSRIIVGGDEALVISRGNGTNNPSWTFGDNGNLTFPDGTIQTTAWAGGRVRPVSPTHSTGAEGDKAGDMAFDGNYFYYCTANYGVVGHQVTVATLWNGATAANTNSFQLTRTADTLQITVGDTISDGDGGATSTVVSVSSDANYTYVSTGGMAYNANFPLTFTSTSPAYVSGGNIWKRISWSGDTW